METIKIPAGAGLPRILFGNGKFAGLPGIIRSYGSQALIITGGGSLRQSGRLAELVRGLTSAQVQYHIVATGGEPAAQTVDAIAREFGRLPLDVVAAIGGGSVLDCGKAVAAMLKEKGPVQDYLEGVGSQKPSGAKVPFIAVPTTAGTGSEATRNAVLGNRREGFKKSLRHDAYVPDVALVDPELTDTCPPAVTIACGLDAVAQLIESYTSVRADGSRDDLILQALALASASLFAPESDSRRRENMSWAALVSGIALNQAGLGAVHGLAGPLGGLFPVPHGLACGKLLFPVMSFVVKKVEQENNGPGRQRFAALGRVLTGSAGGDDGYCCRQFLDVLLKWSQSLKLPQLSRFGMQNADIGKALARAESKNSPAALTPQEMKAVLEMVR